jgi:DNA repair protein RadC
MDFTTFRAYEIGLEIRHAANGERHQIRSARDIYDFMKPLERESAEFAYALLMNLRHEVHSCYLIGKGPVDFSPMCPAEIYKAALVTNSPAFAVVHNHPSGDPSPSINDRDIANRLSKGAEILGLTFLDSVIVGAGRYFSFRESQMLSSSGDSSSLRVSL